MRPTTRPAYEILDLVKKKSAPKFLEKSLYWSYGVFAIETTSAKRLAEKNDLQNAHPLQAQILRNTPFERRRPFATPGASRRRRPRRKSSWKKFARVSPFPYPLRGFLGVSIVLNRPFSTFSSSSSGAPGRSAAHPSLFPRRLVDGVPGLGTRLWRVSALPGIVVVVVVVGSQNLPPKNGQHFVSSESVSLGALEGTKKVFYFSRVSSSIRGFRTSVS